jgi:hypothetical protein
MAQAVSRRPVTPDMPVHFLKSQYWICGGRRGKVAQLAPGSYVPLLYHCTIGHPHLLLHVTLTRKAKGRSLETLEVKFFRKFGSNEKKI